MELALRAVSDSLRELLPVVEVLSCKASSQSKGEVVVTLEGSAKPEEGLAARINDIVQGVNVFKSNYKAKTQQLTVLFKLVDHTGTSKDQEAGQGSAKAVAVSALRECSEEIVALVLSKLDREEVRGRVEQILARFQTDAYARGFMANRHAEQNARLQAPL
jgi:hypothetical protein